MGSVYVRMSVRVCVCVCVCVCTCVFLCIMTVAMLRVSKSGRFASSDDHVARVIVLRAVVSAAEFELVSFRFNGK